jgi:hypothetical protein
LVTGLLARCGCCGGDCVLLFFIIRTQSGMSGGRLLMMISSVSRARCSRHGRAGTCLARLFSFRHRSCGLVGIAVAQAACFLFRQR